MTLCTRLCILAQLHVSLITVYLVFSAAQDLLFSGRTFHLVDFCVHSCYFVQYKESSTQLLAQHLLGSMSSCTDADLLSNEQET